MKLRPDFALPALVLLCVAAVAAPLGANAVAASPKATLIKKLNVAGLNVSTADDTGIYYLRVTGSGRVLYSSHDANENPTISIYESGTSGPMSPDGVITVASPDRVITVATPDGYPTDRLRDLDANYISEKSDGSMQFSVSNNNYNGFFGSIYTYSATANGTDEPTSKKSYRNHEDDPPNACSTLADPRDSTGGNSGFRSMYGNVVTYLDTNDSDGINYAYCDITTGQWSASRIKITKNLPKEESCNEVLASSNAGIFYTENHAKCYSWSILNHDRNPHPMEYESFAVGTNGLNPKPVHKFRVKNVLSVKYGMSLPHLDSEGRFYISTGSSAKSTSTVTISRFPVESKGTPKSTSVLTFKMGKYFRVLNIDNQNRIYILQGSSTIYVYQLP